MSYRMHDQTQLPPNIEVDFAYHLFIDKYNKYGEEEAEACREVVKSGRLSYALGSCGKMFELRLRDELGCAGCVLVSSGTAAVHVALSAVGVDFGDEVVTTPIADTGTVIPIFLQGAVPIFADVDPRTLMITADSIQSVLSERTRAIIVVHYGGYPADLAPILKLAQDHDIAVVEDCAQAMATVYQGTRVGTLGDAGCFSTNDTKHVSCGDGGFVISRKEQIVHRSRLFHDKGFNRVTGIRDPEVVGPNYRMTELQAAVLSSQWKYLEERVQRRGCFADRINDVLERIPWVSRIHVPPGDRCSYFSYLFSVSDDAPLRRDDICRALCEVGLPARPGNLYDCLYKLRMFHGGLPRFMRQMEHPGYDAGLCPNAERANARFVRLEVLESFGSVEADRFAHVFRNFMK